MTKLADAIRRTQRVDAAPMGFGAARSAAPPTMLVGVLVDGDDIATVVAAGADVVIINAGGSLAPDGVKKAREAAPSAVIGAMTAVADSEAATALKEAGLDFLVVSDSTPAAALLEDDLGYTLALPNQPEELFLRSLGPMSFEALYLAETPSPLTVAGQIGLSRIAALAGKPLLTRAPGDASKDDLRCLRSVGVAGVITDAAGVAALKETVKSLPPRRGKREDRAVVSLPHSSVGGGHDHDDDDDDDE
jgi:hypothetical protein